MIEGFVHTAREDKRDFIEAEIGDAKQDKFFPQVKVKRFDNEFNFSARYKHDGKGKESYKREEGKIVWKKGKKEAHFYEIENGYEFEVILNEKPTSNIVEFTLQTKGIDFYYQPELTDDEKARGFERPENIIGSYAVYSSEAKRNRKGGKKYGTGKIGHIYRPKIIDAKGQEIWGILNIDKEILTIEIPQEFLDSATYPVIVDPTFGYAVVGGSTAVAGSAAGAIGSLKSTEIAMSGDIVTAISFYAAKANNDEDIKTGIYTVSAGELNTRLGAVGSVTVNASARWWTTTHSLALTAGVEYGLAYGDWGGGVGTENTRLYYDSGPSGSGSANNTTPLPTTWSESANYSFFFSLYATFTREPIEIDYSYSIFIDKAKL